MRIVRSIICLCWFAAASVAQAADDRAGDYLAEFLSLHFESEVKEVYQQHYVKAYTHALQQKSINVRDTDRLGALLTEELSDHYARDFRVHLHDRVLSALPEDRKKRLVSFLKDNPGLFDVENVQPEAESWADQLDQLPFMVLTLRALTELPKPKVDLDAPFMAEFYATPGLFDFPNRIYRRDMINAARANDQSGSPPKAVKSAAKVASISRERK